MSPLGRGDGGDHDVAVEGGASAVGVLAQAVGPGLAGEPAAEEICGCRLTVAGPTTSTGRLGRVSWINE